MKKYTATDISNLVHQFTNQTLPKVEWTHEAHIIVAFWHNVNYDFETALNTIRLKIIAYNEAVETPNTEDSGYHETLTVFWMMLTKNYVFANPHLEIQDLINNFLSSPNAQTSITFEYYTKAILFSKAARKSWINGDLKPIKIMDLNSPKG